MKRLELPPRALLNLVLAGAMIRIIGLLVPHSLWLDEGATWSNATQPTWGDTLTAEANHPPLWWLITRAWLAVSGDGSEAAGARRAASALARRTTPVRAEPMPAAGRVRAKG